MSYPEFKSKHAFTKSNLAARFRAIDWFANCGKPMSIDLTMLTKIVDNWSKALGFSKRQSSDSAKIESLNQLRTRLDDIAPKQIDRWNDVVGKVKESPAYRIAKRKIEKFQQDNKLEVSFLYSCMADILMALLENYFLKTKHHCFYNLELLMVYEAGHFPCGWVGKWPKGHLEVY